MRKPNAMKEAEIELIFSSEGKEYSVKRIIRKKKANEAYLYAEDNRLIAGPKQTDVTERIQGLLGIDYNLFSRAIYCIQNEIDYFLRLSPGDRKKKLDELFELGRYEEARANANKAKNRLRELVGERHSFLKGFDEDREKADLSMEEEKLKEIEKESGRAVEELKERKAGLAEKRKELLALEKNKESFDEAQAQLIRLKASLKELDEAIGGKKALGRDSGKLMLELNEAKKALSGIRLDAEELIKEIEAKNTEKKIIEAELEELSKKARTLDEKEARLESLVVEGIKEKERILSRHQANLSMEESRLELVSGALNSLKKASANCPTCETALGEAKKKTLLKEKSVEEKDLSEKVRLERAQLLALEKELAELRERLEEKKQLEREVKELRQFNELMKEKKEKLKGLGVEKLKERLLAIKKSFDKEEEKLNELKETMRVSEFIEKRRLALAEAEEKEKIIKELSFNESGFIQKSNVIAREEEKINSLNGMKQKLLDAIDERKHHIKSIEKNIERIEGWKKEADSFGRASEKLSLFADALEKTQADLRKHLIESINIAMDDLWSKLYPYQDYLSAQIQVNEGDYDLVVKEVKGNWVKVEGMLSGGERSAAAITIRIAISLVLAKRLSWIILDEPTHNLDSAAVEALARMLKEHLPELVEQIFIITHDKELEKAASSTVYLLNRNKDLDEATKPELLSRPD
jgi:exonuclease SbcC